MVWVFLSPHFDDAAFSCGGLIWEQSTAGDAVQVWTICGGDIPPGDLSQFAQELHNRWQTGTCAVEHRRGEDNESCRRIKAAPVRFPVPDCIYRRQGDDYFSQMEAINALSEVSSEHLYTSEESIFGSIHPAEIPLVHSLCERMASQLPEEANLVCPLTFGGHVDHRLVREAAEMLKRTLWYYADMPYVFQNGGSLTGKIEDEWEKVLFQISQSGLEAWLAGIMAHDSQISTFWAGSQAVRMSLGLLIERFNGFPLWKSG